MTDSSWPRSLPVRDPYRVQASPKPLRPQRGEPVHARGFTPAIRAELRLLLRRGVTAETLAGRYGYPQHEIARLKGGEAAR